MPPGKRAAPTETDRDADATTVALNEQMTYLREQFAQAQQAREQRQSEGAVEPATL
ncbi:MAG: hypothetical protein O7I42_20645 [Alphaproteobacteria bacterium]|nr:hypothetical protein [Alphaproteobacteria bacterium]